MTAAWPWPASLRVGYLVEDICGGFVAWAAHARDAMARAERHDSAHRVVRLATGRTIYVTRRRA